MTHEEKTEKTSEERELTPGEKFLKEYLKIPYTNDRVGRIFVILHPGIYMPAIKIGDADGENRDQCEQEKEMQ